MSDDIQISEAPSLKAPSLIAAWPGMGNVALLTIKYMIRQLNAQPFAEIAPGDYFAPTGAMVKKQLIAPPEKPKNNFYYYQSADGKNDILFFVGSSQPISHREYAFASKILDFASSFGAKMIYTSAAAPSDMHFQDKPRVFAVPNSEFMLKKMMEHHVHFMGEGNIAGMNGLLISIATERSMNAMCLLGEIPFFTAQIEFPHAAVELLRVFSRLLDVKIDLSDLELYASKKEKELKPLSALLVKEDEPKPQEDAPAAEPENEDNVPETTRLKVEKLFKQAEFDGTYKSKMRLKETLDEHGLFDEYLDRFLDLFKKTS